MLPRLTMAPPSRMISSPYLQQWKTPERFTPTTAPQSSRDIFAMVRSRMIAALLTRKSIPPRRARRDSIIVRTASASEISAAASSALPGRSALSSAARRAASARGPSRPGWFRTTAAPARWKARAICAPMPCEAPVTSTVFPVRSIETDMREVSPSRRNIFNEKEEVNRRRVRHQFAGRPPVGSPHTPSSLQQNRSIGTTVIPQVKRLLKKVLD